jgi:16S rRNA (cytidine1402-2'-O)-methyltransferase
MNRSPGADPETASPSLRQYAIAGKWIEVPPLRSGLYIVSTPIGNLRDVTLRALEVLASADVVACEDTRVTRKLLDHYGIGGRVTAYHDHNAEAARPKLLDRVRQGASVALVSDAGTPLLSDPGFKLVRAARELGFPVTVVPGASSVLAALVVAGLPAFPFLFEGFLPAKPGARRARIETLARFDATLVLFETGPRLAAALGDLAAVLGDREAAVCRELTKLHEEVRRGSLPALAQTYASGGEKRGEFTLVIAPGVERLATSAEVADLLRKALPHGSLKDAVDEVAALTGRPRRDVYREALSLTRGEKLDAAD